MQKIKPFLWINGRAAEAARLYSSVFPDSEIHSNLENSGNDIQVVDITINGTDFLLFNGGGGVEFPFTESISFFVNCVDQVEVDRYWDALVSDGGSEGQCGWLKDKFGVSWQIVPNALGECLGNPDREKAQKALNAMLSMKKIVVADLYKAMK